MSEKVVISCGNSNPSAATRTRRHFALAYLFFQFLVTFVTVNIGAITYVLPYSLKLLKLVFSERDALSYCTLYRAVKFNASGHNCSEACCGFGATPAKMQAVVSVLDKHMFTYRRSKSQRNLNEEVVPNTATTIAKSNFQGATHNIIHTLSYRHTREARKPNHVFRSRVGLSTIFTRMPKAHFQGL